MLLSPVHQRPFSRTPEHVDHAYMPNTASQALCTPARSPTCPPQSNRLSLDSSPTESHSHRSQHTSPSIYHSPEASPVMSRKLRGWVRSSLTQGPDRPIFGMNSNEDTKIDQNVFHKENQRPPQEYTRPSSAPTDTSSHKNQPLFGSANDTGSPMSGIGYRSSSSRSRDEQFRLERLNATHDSQQAKAVLLRQGVATRDFQIEVDKRDNRYMSAEERELRYSAQRRLAESFRRGKGI